MPSTHTGQCGKLLTFLVQVFPESYENLQDHLGGNPTECLSRAVGEMLNQAISDFSLISKYARFCKQFFDISPIDPEKSTNLQFLGILRNQLQQLLKNIRENPIIFKNTGEQMRFNEQIHNEVNPSKRMVLIADQKIRLKSRQMVLATVKLIGELYNVGLITNRIVDLCLGAFIRVNEVTELDIDCFFTLITTTGGRLESKPEGIEIVEKNLNQLEVVIDRHASTFSARVREVIINIFKERINWQLKADEPCKFVNEFDCEILQKMKIDRKFHVELHQVLVRIKSDRLLEFMESFKKIDFIDLDRLEGAVKIMFEFAMKAETKDSSMQALVFRGLRDVTCQNQTFEDLVKNLCHQEIQSLRQKIPQFRSFNDRVQALKYTQDVAKLHLLKASFKRELVQIKRVVRFSEFFGELYNANAVESRMILDYFVVLLASESVCDVSVECFCSVFKTVGLKLTKEKNRLTLMLKSLEKLQGLFDTHNLSIRSRDLGRVLEISARHQFGLTFKDRIKVDNICDDETCDQSKNSIFSTEDIFN